MTQKQTDNAFERQEVIMIIVIIAGMGLTLFGMVSMIITFLDPQSVYKNWIWMVFGIVGAMAYYKHQNPCGGF